MGILRLLYQDWEGFQGFIGTVGDDSIYGTGMYSNTAYHDDANPLFTMNLRMMMVFLLIKERMLFLVWVVTMKFLPMMEMTLSFLMLIVLIASYGYSGGESYGYWNDGGWNVNNVVMAGHGDDVIALGMDDDVVFGGESSGGHHHDEL